MGWQRACSYNLFSVPSIQPFGMLLSLLSFALPLAASLPNPSQQPFQLIADDLPPDLSAELFRSVHGLLKSWSQAFQPIGR